MLTDTTEISLVTEALVATKHWAPESTNGLSRNAPLLLVSDRSDNSQWTAYADVASESGQVYAVWDIATYPLIQTIWAIGEPVSVIAQGKQSGDIALEASRWAKGAIRALVLVDYGLGHGESSSFDAPTCPLLLIRGRQSEIADHEEVVKARAAIGEKVKLVELENCGSRAAESCPQDFAASIEWFLRSDAD